MENNENYSGILKNSLYACLGLAAAIGMISGAEAKQPRNAEPSHAVSQKSSEKGPCQEASGDDGADDPQCLAPFIIRKRGRENRGAAGHECRGSHALNDSRTNQEVDHG